ncbi:MAG: HAD family hydrolase [Lachnospiraceae bacterium]|nr:HAD family hydrolase [Lachnospiraceae bacterium]
MIEIFEILEVTSHIEGLKAVIFDMDDTLYGEKEYVRSGYQKIAQVIPQVEDAGEKLWKFFEEKKPAIDELLKQEGLDSEEIKQACLRAYRYQEPDIHLYPGVEQMLKDLRSQGYLIGIITDGRPEGQRAKIRALGLEELVDHILVTDEFGGAQYRKPNPIAFERMREKLGAEYSQMCYVGDNVNKDFIAPQKLGMKSIWFKNRDGLYVR